MKRFLSFFAFAAIVIGFAACGGNDGNVPAVKAFLIQMETQTATNASFTITPASEATTYFWYVYPLCEYEDCLAREEYSSEEKYVDGKLKLWASPNTSWKGGKSRYSKTGTATINEEDVRMAISLWGEDLIPNTEFRIAICKIDGDKKRVGDYVFDSFTTKMPICYVDLGLPSGNLWNDASVLKADGEANYYTYEGAEDYLSDAASYEHIPSTVQWDELYEQCTFTWRADLSSVNGQSNYKDIPGYVITGPNGNRIFMPAVGGIKGDGSHYGMRLVGMYWADRNGPIAKVAFFSKGSNVYSIKESDVDEHYKYPVFFYCPSGESVYVLR